MNYCCLKNIFAPFRIRDTYTLIHFSEGSLNSPLKGVGGKWVVTRKFESKTKQVSTYFRYLLDSEYSTFKYKQINMTEVSLLIIYKNKQRLVVVIRKEYPMVPHPYFAHVQEEVNSLTPSLSNPCRYLYSLHSCEAFQYLSAWVMKIF